MLGGTECAENVWERPGRGCPKAGASFSEGEQERTLGVDWSHREVPNVSPGFPSTGAGVGQLEDKVGQRDAQSRAVGWASDGRRTGEPGTASGTDTNQMCQSGTFLS